MWPFKEQQFLSKRDCAFEHEMLQERLPTNISPDNCSNDSFCIYKRFHLMKTRPVLQIFKWDGKMTKYNHFTSGNEPTPIHLHSQLPSSKVSFTYLYINLNNIYISPSQISYKRTKINQNPSHQAVGLVKGVIHFKSKFDTCRVLSQPLLATNHLRLSPPPGQNKNTKYFSRHQTLLSQTVLSPKVQKYRGFDKWVWTIIC